VWQLCLIALLGLALLRILSRICRRRGIPPLPWRLPALALCVWSLGSALLGSGDAESLQQLIKLTIEMLQALACSRLLIWLLLELPTHYRLLPATPKILRDLLFVLVAGLIVAITLQQRANVNVLGVVTTSAVITAIIGLAAQEPLKDLLGGLSLHLDRSLSEGDWIETNGQIGNVRAISWRDTQMRCIDGSNLIIPNASITSSNLRNFSAKGPYGNRLFIGLSYSFPPGQAKALLLQLANQHPLVLNQPPAVVRIASFDDSSIRYELLAWQADYGQSLGLRSDLMEQLWYALARQGQSIPYPVRELLYLQKNNKQAQQYLKIESEQKLEVLTRNALFKSLSQNQLMQLIEHCQCHSYACGETIVVEGAEGDSLFVICRGLAQVSRELGQNNSIEVAQLGPGDIFGEMTLFGGERRSATVRVTQETQLLEIDRPVIADLLEDDPDLLERFGLLVSQRAAELNQLESSAAQAQQHDILQRMRVLFNSWLR
jgi:small-conductance mechanosensitive channel